MSDEVKFGIFFTVVLGIICGAIVSGAYRIRNLNDRNEACASSCDIRKHRMLDNQCFCKTFNGWEMSK